MIRVGSRRVQIGWAHEFQSATVDARSRDQAWALRFFQAFRRDEDTIRLLRRFMVEQIDGVAAWRDDELLLRLSWELSHGRIRLVDGDAHVDGPSAGGADSKEAEFVLPPPAPEPPPAPRPAVATKAEPPPSAPEKPSLPQNLDPAATAKTLQKAAASGSPFCEVCAKAAAAAAIRSAPVPAPVKIPEPPPPPPPVKQAPVAERSTLPPDLDSKALAATMEMAAEAGSPFCEVCAKLAAEAMARSTPALAAPTPVAAKLPDPPPAATLPENLDTKTQAAAMEGASEAAAPFCEVCAKAAAGG